MASTDLTLTIARLSGALTTLSGVKADVDSLSMKLSSQQAAATQAMSLATTELQGMAGYRAVSSVDEAAYAERQAGQEATIDYIKANPACSASEGCAAWDVAALASRPADEKWLLHSSTGLLQQYSQNLFKAKLGPDASWETFRAIVVATPKATLMGM